MPVSLSRQIQFYSFSLLYAATGFCPADVVISEISGASSDRLLKYSESGQPSLGTGVPWFGSTFDDAGWASGPGPFGYGLTGIATDLSETLQGKAPSLYLRKTFSVSASQAASSADLLFVTQFDDGIIVFLNGVEVERCHMGPPGMFLYSDQIAFNRNPPSAEPVPLTLGPTSDLLVEGENVIAVQLANHDLTSPLFFSGALRIDSETNFQEVVSDEFSTANGSSKTHINLSGVINESSSGVPAAGGWLEQSPAVVSDGAWEELEVRTISATGAGESGDGAMIYEVMGTGDPGSAVISFPGVSMASYWQAGAVTAADLAETKVSFRFQGDLDTAYDFVVTSPDGAVTASGFPLVEAQSEGVAGYWRFDEEGASAGAVIAGADDSSGNGLGASPSGEGGGIYSTDVPATTIFDPLSNTSRVNQFSMDVSGPSRRMGIPNSQLLNASFTVEMFLKIDGEPNGYNPFMRRSESSLSRWQIDFDHASSGPFGRMRARLDTPDGLNSNFVVGPTGREAIPESQRIWIDTDSGNGQVSAYNDPGDWARDGDGVNDVPGWHHIALTLDETSGVVRFYYDYELIQTRTMNGVGAGGYQHPQAVIEFGKFGSQYEVLMDEVRYTARVLEADDFLQVVPANAGVWTTYEVDLGQADPAERAALIAHLNASQETSFFPGLRVRAESYSASGKSLTLDRFEVGDLDGGANNTLVAEGSDWAYHPGVAEPSGGVYEPALPGETRAEFVDWIELQNSGGEPVDLTGWSLTDDGADLRKWTFPEETVIPANGHLLVLADELDTSGFEPEFLHANFRLSREGEYLALVDESGNFRTEFAGGFAPQRDFYSFGLRPGGIGFVYLEEATPGAANAGTFYNGFVGKPDFGTPGGFHAGTVTLPISSPTPGAVIRYTTDGSEPTLENGIDYSGILSLSRINSRTAHTIRARAFVPGMIPSETKSATYLIGQSPNLTAVPALILSGDRERSFTKPHGIMTIKGGSYPDSFWQADGKDDYNMPLERGRPFERPAFVEFYRSNSTLGFGSNAGIRLAASNFIRPRLVLDGVESSPWQVNSREKPSFNLYFRNEYEKSSIPFPIFGDDYPVTTFEQLRPRAGKNDGSNPYIKDEVMRRLSLEMGQIGSRGVFNSLYLNGEWKGVYNLCERLREPFFQSHYPGSDDWDIRQAGNPNGNLAGGDLIAWDELNTRLQATNVTNEANWNSALELVDPVAMADYFLLNIYGGTWDWPNNNWVTARERSPEGRFRFYVWDAEGAFGHPRNSRNSRSEKPVNFNIITGDLLSRSDPTSRLFQRLHRWPEFRLIMADRIQKHFFNSGTLDDSTPADSRVKEIIDETGAEFAPLLAERFGESLDLEFWRYWTAPGASRRSYLLGPNDEHFRDAGYWPETGPPSFGQDGGEVPQGFALEVSAGSGTIYYTLDGSDPRGFGGTVSPGASVYGGPISLPASVVTVMSRLRSPQGEWSALSEAGFQVGLSQPEATNLVVSEIHYHPAAPNAAEIAAGFSDAGDFEFIQLQNIGGQPLDLSGMSFNDGILFDFSDGLVRSLDPGAFVMVVRNLDAFRARYGPGYDDLLAGQYGGALSNGGEQITLSGPAGVIRSFRYDDVPPWPVSADGEGISLVLVNPESNPDHAVAGNWMGSASIGGLPGGQPAAFPYATWLTYVLAPGDAVGPDDDPDGDGLPNLLEFYLGSLPGENDSATYAPRSSLVEDGGERFLTFEFPEVSGRANLTGEVQSSPDLEIWSAGGMEEMLPVVSNGDGSVTRTFRSPTPVSGTPKSFLRLRVVEQAN